MNRKNFGKRLESFIKTYSGSKKEFATQIDVSPQALQKYLKGERLPLPEMLDRIKALGCNLNWLISGDGDMIETPKNSAKSKLLPLLAEVDCGIPLFSQISNDTIKYIEISDINYYFNPFVVIAKGDSMSPFINQSDYLVCADDPDNIKDGKPVVINYKTMPEHYSSNAKLIKFLDDDRILSYSINPKYPPVILKKSDVYKIYKVIKIIRDIK